MTVEPLKEIPVVETMQETPPFVNRFFALYCYITDEHGYYWTSTFFCASGKEAQGLAESQRHVPGTIRVFEIPEAK